MKSPLIFLWLLLSLVLPLNALAQDGGSPAGWPILQQCLTPTPPPESWSFDGTILLKGYAGIHGVNDAWATPRVLVFLDDVNFPSQLSPDGRWYAEIRSNHIQDDSGWFITIKDEWINLYSTVSPDENRSIPWSNTYRYDNRTFLRFPRWWDIDHLMYEADARDRIGMSGGRKDIFLINPLTGEMTIWLGKIDPFNPLILPAPDWQRIILNESKGMPIRGEWGVYSIDNELINPLPHNFLWGDWAADSSSFAATFSNATDYSIIFFDRDGETLDTLLLSPKPYYDPGFSWSPDNRFLALTLEHRLHIVHRADHVIIDTCLDISAWTWSPTGSQLAVMAEGSDQRPIYILDLERNGLYPVAYHSGTIIGWRAD